MTFGMVAGGETLESQLGWQLALVGSRCMVGLRCMVLVVECDPLETEPGSSHVTLVSQGE